MVTRRDVFANLRRRFAEAGIGTPDLDARILLTDALGIAPADLAIRPDAPVDEAAAERLAAFSARRLAREPVGRILGRREFWGLSFELSPATLEPRPDTETVVAAALAAVPDREAPLRILDLGTGTGCLLVALLHEVPASSGVAVDRSVGALGAARRNAARNGVSDRAAFVAGDWAAALSGRFDLVVSNPPYVATSELARLDPEVRYHDPIAALDGGADGLAAYRAILADTPRLLAPAGRLVLEIGFDQEQDVCGLLVRVGLALEAVAPDLGGWPRAITASLGKA